MYSYDSSPLDAVRLFSMTLRRLLAVPELALFLGTALLLVIVGLFAWMVRYSRRM